jgi:hypothetical protein
LARFRLRREHLDNGKGDGVAVGPVSPLPFAVASCQLLPMYPDVLRDFQHRDQLPAFGLASRLSIIDNTANPDARALDARVPDVREPD